jgi:hypothetical protein
VRGSYRCNDLTTFAVGLAKEDGHHMVRMVSELSTDEFEALVERAVDRRLQVWLTQVMDALGVDDDEGTAEFKPEFAASLRRAIDQAERGEGIDLETFRSQLGR